jgi:hypothetical protein
VSSAHCDGMRISAFIHRALVYDLIFGSDVNSRVFFWRRATTGYQYLCITKSY